jgi:dCMP deaminase
MPPRISWQEYFIACLDAAALRASCDRGKSGAIIVKDNRILATGYVGAPSGLPSCDEIGHELIKKFEMPIEHWNDWSRKDEDDASVMVPNPYFLTHCIRTIHAEQNAIINCARNGISTLSATLYCTMTPCHTCAMSIVQAGITKVVAKNRYQKDEQTKDLFYYANIELVILNNNLLSYTEGN